MEKYYHLFANGADARNFITNKEEMKAAFNRVGLCSSLTGAVVVAFSIEESHPHILLWGEYQDCMRFESYYVDISVRCIARRRGSLDGVKFHCELYEVSDPSYLRTVAMYTIIQPTKDGKPVMPYDYLYGSGPLYFRSEKSVLPWLLDDEGKVCKPVRFGELNERQKQIVCGSTSRIPEVWLVCNGYILPSSYVDIERFEDIYRTHNCFRVFMSSGKDKYSVVQDKMASVRGVMIDDLEARQLSETITLELFGRKGTRHITPQQRIILARELRRRYSLSMRQISVLTKLPEAEIREYIK